MFEKPFLVVKLMESCRKSKIDYEKVNNQQVHSSFSLKLALDFYTGLLCYGWMRGVAIIDFRTWLKVNVFPIIRFMLTVTYNI